MPRTQTMVGAVLLAALLTLASGCAKRRPPTVVVPRIGATETGVASWYGNPYHGRRAANGEIYDMEKMTAAHRTFAFGTWVRVHNLDNGQEVEVRITDRGPFIDGRIIDLSRAAARSIEMIGPGLARVRLQVIRAPSNPELAGAVPEVRSESERPIVPEKFCVQVGSFRERPNAERLRTEMERRYGMARMVERDGDPPSWRVLVGMSDTIEDAEAIALRIRSDGGEAFVVRLDTEAR
jgi:rare lipoprotein A